MYSTKERATLFEVYNQAKHLPPENNFELFREMCFNGIPDQFRAQSWRLLMDILPFNDRDSWKDIIKDTRETYYDLFDDYIEMPSETDLSYLKQRDDTLVPREFRIKAGLIEQISLDVCRSFRDLNFFQSEIIISTDCPIYNKDRSLNRKRGMFSVWKTSEPILKEEAVISPYTNPVPVKLVEHHWQAIERILYVFARSNHSIGYIQGMNSLACPLYFVCANQRDEDDRIHAEADAFNMLAALMSDIGDLYKKSLDDVTLFGPIDTEEFERTSSFASLQEIANNRGIGSKLDQLSALLERQDMELYYNMSGKGLEPVYYAFRWISLMFALDFPFPDVLRIWDMAFSEMEAIPCLEPKGFFQQWLDPIIHIGILDFLVQFACAMLLCVRDEIIKGDFDANMVLLQNYPIDVNTVIAQVCQMRSPRKVSMPDAAEKRYKWNIFARKDSNVSSTVESQPKKVETGSRMDLDIRSSNEAGLNAMELIGDEEVVILS